MLSAFWRHSGVETGRVDCHCGRHCRRWAFLGSLNYRKTQLMSVDESFKRHSWQYLCSPLQWLRLYQRCSQQRQLGYFALSSCYYRLWHISALSRKGQQMMWLFVKATYLIKTRPMWAHFACLRHLGNAAKLSEEWRSHIAPRLWTHSSYWRDRSQILLDCHRLFVDTKRPNLASAQVLACRAWSQCSYDWCHHFVWPNDAP